MIVVKNKKGYTFLELMITLGILSLIILFMTQLLGFNIRHVKSEDDALEFSQNARLAANYITRTIRENNATTIGYLAQEGQRIIKDKQTGAVIFDATPRNTNSNSAALWYYYSNGYGEIRDNKGAGNALASYIRNIDIIDMGNYLSLNIAAGKSDGESTDYYVCVPLGAGVQIPTATPPPIPTATPSPMPTPNPIYLVGYYKFEEASGSVKAIDSSVNNNHGEVIGKAANRVPGHSGTAIQFNGNNYVSVPTSESFNTVENELQVDFWCYPTSRSGNIRVLIDKVNGANGYQVYLDSLDRVVFTVKHEVLVTSNSDIIPLFKWSRITVTYRAYDKIRIFINGDLKAEMPVGKRDVKTTTKPLAMGAEWEGTNRFIGYMDEVIIKNKID